MLLNLLPPFNLCSSLSNRAGSEQAGFLCIVTRGPVYLCWGPIWEHTTLQGKALSFTRYPVELNREDVTRSSLFIYLPEGLFLLFSHSPTPTLCASHLTPYIYTYCFHLHRYWSSLISLSSSKFNQVNGCNQMLLISLW